MSIFIRTVCSIGSDVVFAVDASGSIGEQNFEELIYFVMRATTELDIDNPDSGGTRVGMVTFGNDVRHEFDLNSYRYVCNVTCHVTYHVTCHVTYRVTCSMVLLINMRVARVCALLNKYFFVLYELCSL